MKRHIVSIIVIFIVICIGWMMLASTVSNRTHEQDLKLRRAVGKLWGGTMEQKAPLLRYQDVSVETRSRLVNKTIKDRKTGEPKTIEVVEEYEQEVLTSPRSMNLVSSDVDVDINLVHRKKGLMWYATYGVVFSGAYEVANASDTVRDMYFEFSVPSQSDYYDNLKVVVDGKEQEDPAMENGAIVMRFRLQPKEERSIDISYRSQGMGAWWYTFGSDVARLRNFNLNMHTNFAEIDFPQQAISPTVKNRDGDGWNLNWSYENLVSGIQIGIDMPQKLNPGPWVQRLTEIAPVSLFFFFFMLGLFAIIRKLRIHPVNYFFLGAAFFSYHLLLAYLVDHLSIHLAFWIASVVSVALVVSYMRLVINPRFAFVEIAIAQMVYLVGFSYTVFFEGYTGLAITVMSIATLFVSMQTTARIDWDSVFSPQRKIPAADADDSREDSHEA